MDIRTETRRLGDASHEVVVLSAGGAEAELWPGLGGNCVRWSAPGLGDLLFSPPLDELAGRPTRGGIPVLFPFPNRIRAGKYAFAGMSYQLPLNDSTNQHAIHGFTPRSPWRHDGATMRFAIAADAPDRLPVWPGNLELDVTWSLSASALAADIVVRNPGDSPVPFGLGLHPYLKLAGAEDRLTVPADRLWELVDCLPTGTTLELDSTHDIRKPRPVGGLKLDDVYTGLIGSTRDGLRLTGRLDRIDNVWIETRATEGFREAVVFTPPHGQAVCVEPYTCATDAANLQPEAGWRILKAGEKWVGRVKWEAGRG
ncbi:MAG: aldose 1-epimerase [Gemmataceae bacterium]|nr:aldose 1-epimerase [Gemmataceae bacterium]